MEDRTYRVTGSREVFGTLPAQTFTVKVGPEPEAAATEEQVAALIEGGHITESKAQKADVKVPAPESE